MTVLSASPGMRHFFDDQNSESAVFWPRLAGFRATNVRRSRKSPVVILGLVVVAAVCLLLFRDDTATGDNNGEFVAIAGGSFVMGDSLDKLRDARPHEVMLSPYSIGRHEVTLKLWDQVAGWAHGNGYTDLPPGMAKGDAHPVYGVTRHNAIKWCNARSEMEGRTPCYYEDEARTAVLRTEGDALDGRCVRWEADGYRLPTEAEWERAARGGLQGQRFPWGDEISHQNANYSGSTRGAPYDKSGRNGPPAAYITSLPHTAPVGSFPPNELGLHDMAGNVLEWCWDFYDKHYGLPELANNEFGAVVLNPPPSAVVVKDPHGPDLGISNVARGGSWRHSAEDARCAFRYDLPGGVPAAHVGFRVVRSK